MATVLLNPYSFATEPGITLDLVADFDSDLGAWNEYQYTTLIDETSLVTLTIPAGTFGLGDDGGCGSLPAGPVFGGDEIPFEGMKSFHLQGAGRDVTTISFGNCPAFGGPVAGNATPNPYQGPAPRFASSAIGATSVTLLDLGDVWRFHVGGWVLMVGMDLQRFGYPPNNYFFDHVLLTDIDEGTGVLTFTPPLTYAYKSYWPIGTGGVGGDDTGGPATAMPLNYQWNQSLVVSDITLGNDNVQYMYGNGYSMLWERVNFPHMTPAPSNIVSYRFVDCDLRSPIRIETDKSVEYLEFTNCQVSKLEVQSSTIKQMTLDNCTFEPFEGDGFCNIGARNNTLVDCDVSAVGVVLGCGYGDVKTITAINTVFPPITFDGGAHLAFSQFIDQLGYGYDILSTANDDGNAGIMTFPSDEGSFSNYIFPGAKLMPGDPSNFDTGPIFEILDVVQDVSDVKVHTTMTTGWDATWDRVWTVESGTETLDFQNCTGNAVVNSLSLTDPSVSPWSYFTTGEITGPVPDGWDQVFSMFFGVFVSLTFTCTQAYTGSQSTLVLNKNNGNGPGLWPYQLTHPSGWQGANAGFNLKQAGTKTFTATDVTVTGDQTVGGATPPGANQRWRRGSSGGIAFGITDNAGTPVDISGEDPSVWPIWSWTLELSHP